MSPLRWAEIIDSAHDVVISYDHGVSLRQVYYRLGAAGVLPLTTSAYKHLSSRLAEARRRGEFPELLDAGRQVHVEPVYPDPADLLHQIPGWYRADRTAGQEIALYVGVEKDTLRLQVADWLDHTGIPVLVVRGYGSQSYADIVRHRVATDPRPAVLLYIGDLDASGVDIERDWIARTGCWSHTTRIAVTAEQASDLPPADGKATDPRWPAFAARYGLAPDRPVQWEVEALDPSTLQDLLLGAVGQYIDTDILTAALAAESHARQRLIAFLAAWRD